MEAQQTLKIIRRMRHDFGNYLQVISGYIELEKYEEAKRYIYKITEEMRAEKSIFEIGNADITIYLYEQMLMVRDLGIILKYKDLQISNLDIILNKNEPYNSLTKLTDRLKSKDDEPVVYISLLEKDNGIIIIFNCDLFEQNPITVNIKE